MDTTGTPEVRIVKALERIAVSLETIARAVYQDRQMNFAIRTSKESDL